MKIKKIYLFWILLALLLFEVFHFVKEFLWRFVIFHPITVLFYNHNLHNCGSLDKAFFASLRAKLIFLFLKHEASPSNVSAFSLIEIAFSKI